MISPAGPNTQPSMYRVREFDFARNPYPVFDDVLAYWNELRGDGFAPRWVDFELTRVPGVLLRNTVVVDLDEPSAPIRYRYYGSGIAQSHGFELTGKTSDDIFPEDLRRHIIGQYEIIREARAPKLFLSDIYVKDGVPKRDLLLRLPLSADGARVTGVISFEHRYSEPND